MKKTDGFICILKGTPEERGFQHGYLLFKEIKGSASGDEAKFWHYETALVGQMAGSERFQNVSIQDDSENMEEI